MQTIYNEFKRLHPNCTEAYYPTPENVARWKWHIAETQKRPVMEEVESTVRQAAFEIAQTRSYKTFYEMPKYMQERYLYIAGLFPGVQIYACGSRVNGEYIEEFSGASIKRLRVDLGKLDKTESDYDFCADIVAPDQLSYQVTMGKMRREIPFWADLLRGAPEHEKIAIPMWDFDRLPITEHKRVKELFDSQQWGELMEIHNAYQLSPNFYCCEISPIIRYFRWAIENGKIIDDAKPQENQGSQSADAPMD